MRLGISSLVGLEVMDAFQLPGPTGKYTLNIIHSQALCSAQCESIMHNSFLFADYMAYCKDSTDDLDIVYNLHP